MFIWKLRIMLALFSFTLKTGHHLEFAECAKLSPDAPRPLPGRISGVLPSCQIPKGRLARERVVGFTRIRALRSTQSILIFTLLWSFLAYCLKISRTTTFWHREFGDSYLGICYLWSFTFDSLFHFGHPRPPKYKKLETRALSSSSPFNPVTEILRNINECWIFCMTRESSIMHHKDLTVQRLPPLHTHT